MHRVNGIHLSDAEALVVAAIIAMVPGAVRRRLSPSALAVLAMFDQLVREARERARSVNGAEAYLSGRITVAEAARREGITRGAIRKQVHRGVRGGHHDPGDGHWRVDPWRSRTRP